MDIGVLMELSPDNHNYQLPPGSRWRKMIMWNPVWGCSPISLGCHHCSSAKSSSHELVTWKNGEPHFNGTIIIDEEAFSDIKYFDDNGQVFVCGWSDLFHEKVPDDIIMKIIFSANERPDCTFFVLTKRAERMHSICSRISIPKNFWIGITVECEKYVDRIRCFEGVNSVKVVSGKPLLSNLNLKPFKDLIDLMIVGGEYNYNNLDLSRPMNPDWVRSIRDQCVEMNIPFSFHNWGSWVPCNNNCKFDKIFYNYPFRYHDNNSMDPYLLDGEIWDQYPDTHC